LLYPDDSRKLARSDGRLWNSTKIATQFLGLEQSSPKTPVTAGKLKQRLDGHQGTATSWRLSYVPTEKF
jgi:hypothetical protein